MGPLRPISKNAFHGILQLEEMEKLPDEIVLEIFLFLDIPSLGAIFSLSKRFSSLAEKSSLWKAVTLRAFPFAEDIQVGWKEYCQKLIVVKREWSFEKIPEGIIIENNLVCERVESNNLFDPYDPEQFLTVLAQKPIIPSESLKFTFKILKLGSKSV